ncbi:UNVERIFIED_CONTAM: Zinc finger CCCH domain-containing protein 49 [Sesamum latifolium]|uniref:Zinc finger CCCH domain-containing protein 49 n=1 Tax=Sesamum latifolium TaxID=2727402 RepID=A0AAW2XL66_9LAMI
MPSLEAPEDESIRTLYVGGLDARVTEQDLRDNFYAHGEIESVKMVLQRACAFLPEAETAMGKPQVPKPETEGSDEAKQQAAVAHSGLLPRAVIFTAAESASSAPGTQNQPPPMPYFNIPHCLSKIGHIILQWIPRGWVPLSHLKRGLPVVLDLMKVKVGQSRSSHKLSIMVTLVCHPLQVNSIRHIIHRMGICRFQCLHLINSTLSRINLGCLPSTGDQASYQQNAGTSQQQ